MNLVEKMFSLWPVDMDVVNEKGAVEESGWWAWMLRYLSSEPEASSRPERDQLVMHVGVGFQDDDKVAALT